ncbi:MAG TPA: hypothetical protein VN692_04475 [Steroidobacteraceae bacterium]|nr:hypothetical protein [Steroidobacteraceae bacterium]
MLGLALQGGLSVKSYVDPTLPVISNTRLPKVQQPRPATVLFEFRSKGNVNARAASSMSGRVIAADMGGAVAKGVGTGSSTAAATARSPPICATR